METVLALDSKLITGRIVEASEESSSTKIDHSKTVSFDLPFDIITEIMLRLPVKSLIRFKLVCKTWYALIENPNFVDKYQITGPVIASILEHPGIQFYLKDEGVYKTISLDSSILAEQIPTVVGICGGLVCVALWFADYDYIIGNPAIRDFRRISKSKLSKSVDDLVFDGFSSFSGEYKLVRVIYHIADIGKVEVKAEAYTMSTDIWVEIDVKMGRVDNFVHLIDYERPTHAFIPVVVNDILYWEAPNSMDGMHVVSFNIFTGFFDEINVPINLVTIDEAIHCWKIIEYEGKLSFIVCCGDRRFELWVLDEYSSSWTQKLRINSIPTVAIPSENWEDSIEVIHYTKSGKLLVSDRYCVTHMEILLYDLSSRETKALSCFNDEVFDFYFYTESLRTVKRRNDFNGAD